MSDYDDIVRDTAVRVVRARTHRIDRKLLLVAVRRQLNLPITKREFSRIMQGYLKAEPRRDQRGRIIGTWLDLPERVELRRQFSDSANAREGNRSMSAKEPRSS